MTEYPALSEIFPFEYMGTGYFRRCGIPKDIPAEILHGRQAIKFVYDAMKRSSNTPTNADTSGESQTN